RLGAAERLGLDYPAVASCNPRIVYAAAAGFHKDGKYRDRPSFDDVIQGESGLAALNGGAGGEPRYVPMAVCDKICGYVLASAIGMALFHRERTGEGQEVHVPMLERMVASSPPLARRAGRTGKGARLSAHADRAPPAVSDQRRPHLNPGDHR